MRVGPRLIGALALALAAALWSSAVHAQLPGAAGAAAGDSNEPFQIQADSGIEWQQNARVYIARGNAVATRGTSEVRADALIAHYREVKPGGQATSGGNPATPGVNPGGMGGNTEIYRVEAEGHVILKRDTNTVVGDRAVYDVDQAIAVVTGKNIKLTTATDFVTARDSLEWHDQKQVAVARGDAIASRTGKTVKADIITAYMVKTAPAAAPGASGTKPPAARAATPVKPAAAGAAAPPPPGESKISRVDAQGHVVITNTQDTGRGDFGVYNAETGIATLIGNVVLQRGNNVLRGQRGVMDLNNNVSRMLPGGGTAAGEPRQRVQGMFIREEQGKSGAPTGAAKPRPPAVSGAPGGAQP